MIRSYGGTRPPRGEIPVPGAFVLVSGADDRWRWSADEPFFAMVLAMSDNNVDPSGNTEAFRAFTQTPQPGSRKKTWPPPHSLVR